MRFVPDKNLTRGKLNPKSLYCVLNVYSPTQIGYKCFHSPFNRVYITRDVTFWESKACPLSPQGEKSTSAEELMNLDPSCGIPPITYLIVTDISS